MEESNFSNPQKKPNLWATPPTKGGTPPSQKDPPKAPLGEIGGAPHNNPGGGGENPKGPPLGFGGAHMGGPKLGGEKGAPPSPKR